jgi:threonine dehydratase
LAEEEQIIPWMYAIWNETKMIIEPSCAVPFVVMNDQKERLKGKKIAVIITGGNVDLKNLL